jgi:hypothetical protein
MHSSLYTLTTHHFALPTIRSLEQFSPEVRNEESEYFNVRRHIMFGGAIAAEADKYLDSTLQGRKYVCSSM